VCFSWAGIGSRDGCLGTKVQCSNGATISFQLLNYMPIMKNKIFILEYIAAYIGFGFDALYGNMW
jgi:hypothetical protein